MTMTEIDYKEEAKWSGFWALAFTIVAGAMFLAVGLGGGWTAVSSAGEGLHWESAVFSMGAIASLPAARLWGISITAIAILLEGG
ncbi:MAG: hypothetical protein R3313_03520 [Candidatus Saccharimonadales bacterium]|nr:hypothetical protein [Candidatus Saccharimonadales bacterium]